MEGCWLIREGGGGQQMVECYASQGRGWVRSASGQGELRQAKGPLAPVEVLSGHDCLYVSFSSLLFSTLKLTSHLLKLTGCSGILLRFPFSSRNLGTSALCSPYPRFLKPTLPPTASSGSMKIISNCGKIHWNSSNSFREASYLNATKSGSQGGLLKPLSGFF